MNSDVGPSD